MCSFGRTTAARESVFERSIECEQAGCRLVEVCGNAWGARRDVMERVLFGMTQAVEAVREFASSGRPIRIETRFDEFNVDVHLRYNGDLIPLPERRQAMRKLLSPKTDT